MVSIRSFGDCRCIWLILRAIAARLFRLELFVILLTNVTNVILASLPKSGCRDCHKIFYPRSDKNFGCDDPPSKERGHYWFVLFSILAINVQRCGQCMHTVHHFMFSDTPPHPLNQLAAAHSHRHGLVVPQSRVWARQGSECRRVFGEGSNVFVGLIAYMMMFNGEWHRWCNGLKKLRG